MAKFQQHARAMTAALILYLFYDTWVYAFGISLSCFPRFCCSSPSRVDFTRFFGSPTAMGAMAVSRGLWLVLELRSSGGKGYFKKEKIMFSALAGGLWLSLLVLLSTPFSAGLL
ncbi:MAG: hypothetical protein ABSF44_13965 [Candidatus Bathyarchaeia archaeon]|jgi:hypothetical protein